MLRLVESVTITSAQGHTAKFENRGIKGLVIRIRAIKSATSIVETDLAAMRVRVMYKGNDIINAAYATLSGWSNTLLGAKEAVEGGSGVLSTFGIYIPFFKPASPGGVRIANAIHKAENEGLDFYIDAFAVASCTYAICDVYADIDDNAPHLFTPHFIEYASTAAAGNVKTDLVVPNIGGLYITKPSTAPDNVQLLIDGQLVDSADWGTLAVRSNALGQLETSLTSVWLDLTPNGEVSESLGDKAGVMTTGGSGAHYIAPWYFVFDSAKYAYSAMVKRNNVETKLVNKGIGTNAVKVAISQGAGKGGTVAAAGAAPNKATQD